MVNNRERLPGLFEKLKVDNSTVVERFQVTHVISPQGASIRSGPGAAYERIGTLPYMATVKIIARQGNWCQVKFGVKDRVGYIYQNLIGADIKKDSQGTSPEVLIPNIRESAPAVEKDDSVSKSATIINIRFDSQPSSAQLFINGQYVGLTPLRFQLVVGEISILLEKDGFEKYQQRINIEADGRSEFKFELVPLPNTQNQSRPDLTDDSDKISQVFDTIPVPGGDSKKFYLSVACA